MRIAVLFRGGVSHAKGRLSQPGKLTTELSNYVNIDSVAASVRTNLVHHNSNHSFDFFIQSWNPDLQKKLTELYEPKRSCFEPNSSHFRLLRALTLRSSLNETLAKFPSKRCAAPFTRKHLRETFAGLSQALAIQKAANLYLDYDTRGEYDLVFLMRPDVMILKPIEIENYESGIVYCNGSAGGGLQGDFRWVLPPRFLTHFTELLPSVRDGHFHKVHVWIPEFFTRRGVPYRADNLVAGRDEEVLRNVRIVGIPFEKVAHFGITETQYGSYSL